eukprot:NODE_3920_length_510_cov_104.390456_g3344_i0.p2 GENE.NODE_3920_length_510_cov_104.390456_g3344_i0~~NODE_3920_length_510_cov_104.390456_g3344_i0.p2  ORF type:complete len:67 (+),score=9.96 NODE_3920_length_510_cov_104.390456_g3344_i0:148-348(+)
MYYGNVSSVYCKMGLDIGNICIFRCCALDHSGVYAVGNTGVNGKLKDAVWSEKLTSMKADFFFFQH